MKFHRVLSCLLVIFILLFGAKTVYSVYMLNTRYNSVSVSLKNGITKRQLLLNLKEEKNNNTNNVEEISAFAENTGWIQSEELNKSASVLIYSIYGDVENVLPVSLEAGSMLLPDDTYGCVLTDSVAYEIFGSTNVVGNEIEIQGETYVLRGIVKADVDAVFYVANDEDSLFDHLEIKFTKDNGTYYAKQMIQTYRLNANTIVETNYLSKMLYNPVILLVLLLVLAVTECGAYYIKQVRFSHLTWGIWFTGIIVCILITSRFGFFPKRWLPNSWSDIEHYGNIISDILEQLNTVTLKKATIKDALFIVAWMKVVFMIILTFIGEIYLIHKLRKTYSTSCSAANPSSPVRTLTT